MQNASSLTITDPMELAELAARAAEGITCFRFFRGIRECRSDIKAGIALCEILGKGYEIEKSRGEIKAQDVPVWRAFQKASEGTGFDREAFAQFTARSAPVREGLQSVLQNGPVSDADLTNYRRFFLEVAVSLGL